jgi:eukaryotic-like serine/threonine-protein kinase
LGLYGLRTIPMIDRDRSRTLIWETLRAVEPDGRPQLVALRGHLGSGKSRACEWMCQRAHELGCAEYLVATHSATKGPLDGLGPMLARFFRCAGQGPDDVVATIAEKLRWFEDGDELDPYFARALATVVVESRQSPSPEHGLVEFGTPNERYAAVAQLLRLMGRRRPVIVWLDDAHFSREALDFAAHLLDDQRERGLSVLVLITARTEVLDQREHLRDKLDGLLGGERARVLDLGPLAAEDHRQLVQTLLGLDTDLVDEVARRTEGNPLFAVQLVGDWVERGVLEVGQGGFTLRDDVRAPIPDDIYQVWGQRLESVLERFERARRDQVRVALELAAVLGADVSSHEWRSVCALQGVGAPAELVDVLCTLRLARPSPHGWSFSHGMLAESLERSATEAGRSKQHHAACARMLSELYHADTRGIAERRGMHLIAAGDHAAALEPLYEAAARAEETSEYELALRLLEQRRSAIEALGLDPRGKRMAENTLIRLRVAGDYGELDDADQLRDWVEEAAREHQWGQILGGVLLVRSMALWRGGQMREAIEICRLALDGLAEDAPQQRARLLGSQGFAHLRLGEHRAARDCFEEAIEAALEIGDDRLVVRCLITMALVALQQGRWDEARCHVERAQPLVSRSGARAVEGHCWNILGEVARFERNWDAARTYYERSVGVWTSIGSLNAHIARNNMAMVDLVTGHYRRARAGLDRVRPAYERTNKVGVPVVDLGLVACAGVEQDWGAFDTHLELAETSLEQSGFVDRDIAWLADLAADLCREVADASRIERLEKIAHDQWDQLTDEDD